MKQILTYLLAISLIICIETKQTFANDYCHNLPEKTYANLSAQMCDSLIKVNADNPNFVILDIRTPGEYYPKHIEGAINRNYYDSDFTDQLKALDKNKTYLIHCQSGGRSANAFAQMKTLEFREIYNMQGGMNSWNGASLSTTTGFAPKLGIYECSFKLTDTIPEWAKDTVNLKITNYANSLLEITSVNIVAGNNFVFLPENGFSLAGGQNHTIQIIFSPTGIVKDSATINIQSNAGNREIKIKRSSVDITRVNETKLSSIQLYPVPAGERIYIKNYRQENSSYFQILNLDGALLKQGSLRTNFVDISTLKNGLYLFNLHHQGKIISKKLIKK